MANIPQSELELGWQCQLSESVTALSCAPESAGWAASSAAGEVVWNSGANEPIYLQEADGRSIEAVAFSADGRWLAAGGQAGKLLIWDCGDRHIPPRLIQTIEIDRWIEHLVWHPSQPQLAIGSGNCVKIWDALAQREVTTRTFDRSIFDLAWHPDGTELAVAGYKGVQIWTPSAPTATPERIDVDTATIAIAWSADGRYLAAGNLDRTLTIVDRHQPAQCWTLQGFEGKIRQLTWLVGTETPCVAVASGTTIVLWTASADAATWEGRLLTGHQDIVTAARSHPQAPKLASGGADGYTCIWTADGQISQILSHPTVSRFTQISWHPDRLYLATGTQSGHICLWVVPA